MKRGLRVRTGVRAPALVAVHAADMPRTVADEEALHRNMTPLVPLIRCAARTKAGVPCEQCWYCLQHNARIYREGVLGE